MKVIFIFEDKKAQIILEPANPIDQMNLHNFAQLKGQSNSITLGTRKELIIESCSSTEEPIQLDRLP